MFEQEIWKDIPNYEGKYQISNMGRVRNIQTNHIHKNNCSYGLYEKICLERNGKQELLSIHRLVAKAFIPNPQNKKEINHIDGNKRNKIVKIIIIGIAFEKYRNINTNIDFDFEEKCLEKQFLQNKHQKSKKKRLMIFYV